MLTRPELVLGGLRAPDDGTAATSEHAVVPCAARPWTTLVHVDGPCRCFVGGPAPVYTLPADVAALGPERPERLSTRPA